ncbi:MAG: AAA family ATPase [Roseiflexaceae bacterium]
MAHRSLRIVVITAPDQLEQEWINRLSREADVASLERVGLVNLGVELCQQSRPDLVIVDRNLEQSEACIRQIFTTVPDSLCIAIVDRVDLATMRRLVAVGARDIISRPVAYTDLLTGLRATVDTDRERRSLTQLGDSSNHRGRGKLIVTTSPKGGVGTTTIATNLAVGLRQISNARVAIADFGLQFGDVGVLMNIWARNTMQDLFERPDDIDDAMLAGVLQPHTSGVQVLLAPNSPEAAAELDRRTLNLILDRLIERYAYVVCDTWSFLDEITETILSRADEALIVSTPEVPALKNTRSFLDHLEQNKLVRGRTTLVLNRFPSVNGISLEDVKKHLRHDVGANIPSEGKFVTHSVNRGIPVVTSHPQSWVGQSFLKLAAYVTGDDIDTISLDHPKNGGDRQQRPERMLGARNLIRMVRSQL